MSKTWVEILLIQSAIEVRRSLTLRESKGFDFDDMKNIRAQYRIH